MITDEMLHTAAAKSCEIYVAHLEKGYDPEKRHEFSKEFIKKIEHLKRRAKHPVFYKTMYRVASIIFALLITGSAWIVIDAEARAAFFGWVQDICETYFVLSHGNGIDKNIDFVDYRPTWLPEGYAEVKSNSSQLRSMVAYVNDEGKILRFNYIQNPDETDWFFDVSQASIKMTTVNGGKAYLLAAENPEEASSVAWIVGDTAFCITGFVSEADLVEIAESVQIVK